MNKLQIISDIKNQLIERGELPQAQQQFLIDAFSRIEAGEAPAEAFDHAELPIVKRGKQSKSYRDAESTRNIRLKIALTYMDGPSDWQKCVQLAALAGLVRRLTRSETFQPSTVPEGILVRIIESGTRLPITAQGIYGAVFPKN